MAVAPPPQKPTCAGALGTDTSTTIIPGPDAPLPTTKAFEPDTAMRAAERLSSLPTTCGAVGFDTSITHSPESPPARYTYDPETTTSVADPHNSTTPTHLSA